MPDDFSLSGKSVGDSNTTRYSWAQPPAHQQKHQIPCWTFYFVKEQETTYMELSPFFVRRLPNLCIILHCGLVHSVNGLQGILKETNIQKLLTSHTQANFFYLQYSQHYY